MNIYSRYAIDEVTVYVKNMKDLEKKWKSNRKRIIETCIDMSGFAESYIVVRNFRTRRHKKQTETYIEEVKFIYRPAK